MLEYAHHQQWLRTVQNDIDRCQGGPLSDEDTKKLQTDLATCNNVLQQNPQSALAHKIRKTILTLLGGQGIEAEVGPVLAGGMPPHSINSPPPKLKLSLLEQFTPRSSLLSTRPLEDEITSTLGEDVHRGRITGTSISRLLQSTVKVEPSFTPPPPPLEELHLLDAINQQVLLPSDRCCILLTQQMGKGLGWFRGSILRDTWKEHRTPEGDVAWSAHVDLDPTSLKEFSGCQSTQFAFLSAEGGERDVQRKRRLIEENPCSAFLQECKNLAPPGREISRLGAIVKDFILGEEIEHCHDNITVARRCSASDLRSAVQDPHNPFCLLRRDSPLYRNIGPPERLSDADRATFAGGILEMSAKCRALLAQMTNEINAGRERDAWLAFLLFMHDQWNLTIGTLQQRIPEIELEHAHAALWIIQSYKALYAPRRREDVAMVQMCKATPHHAEEGRKIVENICQTTFE